MEVDVFGKALQDYFSGNDPQTLWLHSSYGEPEEMPLPWFFRNESEMPDIELYALDLCRGNVLDMGAGVGSHALALQKNRFDVSAIEISATACNIMKKRGVKKALCQNVFGFSEEKFETLLLLMNGIGLCSSIEGFKGFMDHARKLLKHGGQVLFDSSNVGYLYESTPKPRNHYFGEIDYRYEYKTQSGSWFKWLYLDQETMFSLLKEKNWDGQVIYEDDNDHYLARIWPV